MIDSKKFPSAVLKALETLNTNNSKAYIVGGSVRDIIMGIAPKDFDITASSSPQENLKIFSKYKTFETGIRFGTITVIIDNTPIEITTFRTDGEYKDNRKPENVVFSNTVEHDLSRRDFTINAMAYSPYDGFVDLFDGKGDIEKNIIRAIGNPDERFSEDALRILRALRFASRLGFEIEEETQEGIRKLAPTLANISAERIQVELIKMLISPNPTMMKKAYELGITKVILPEFDAMMETTQETPHHMYTVGEHTLKAMKVIPADKVLRLTMLFHDMAKPLMKTVDEDGRAHFKMHDVKGADLTKMILKRLKFDNDTLNKVVKLVRHHDYRIPADAKSVRRAMNVIGEDLFPMYHEVRLADTLAQSIYLREEKLQNLAEVWGTYEEILEKKQCVSLKDLAISGSDLIANGMQPGKEIGRILNALLELVLENPEYNTKEKLLQLKDEV